MMGLAMRALAQGDNNEGGDASCTASLMKIPLVSGLVFPLSLELLVDLARRWDRSVSCLKQLIYALIVLTIEGLLDLLVGLLDYGIGYICDCVRPMVVDPLEEGDVSSRQKNGLKLYRAFSLQ